MTEGAWSDPKVEIGIPESGHSDDGTDLQREPIPSSFYAEALEEVAPYG